VQQIHAAHIIQEAFQEKTQRLAKIIEQVSKDSSLNTSIIQNDLPATLGTFQSLQSYRVIDDLTIDLIDSNGIVIAWNGPSIASAYKDLVDRTSITPVVYVIQNGLRTYVTMGKRLAINKWTLLVSEPLEVNSPISNRFVRKVSLSEELSNTLKTHVLFKLPHTYVAHQGEFRVPIVNQANHTIAEYYVSQTTVEAKISSIADLFAIGIGGCLACGSVFLALYCLLRITKLNRRWITTGSCIFFLWIVRILWLQLDFPATLIGGWLFNPNLYASPFSFNLTSSLGDLILTLFTVAVSAWLFFTNVISDKTETKRTIAGMNVRAGKVGSVAFAGIITLLVLWLFRGFGEAVRSFVFDSTIQYSNPAEILPTAAAAIMYLNFILLGISLLCVSLALFSFGRAILSGYYHQSDLQVRMIFISIILVCIPMFTFLDGTQLVPFLVSLLFIVFCISGIEIYLIWNVQGFYSVSNQWRLAVWLTAGSFIIGAPLFHQQLQQREHKKVEAVENEFLRPSDSWLNYAVQDGLRTSVESITENMNTTFLPIAKENNLAFVLWAKSLIGKEGYSSALILYDQQGNEVDRFVVGMNKPEQQSILTKVFSGEEEAVHVVDRTDSKLVGKLYGAWTTIRDSSGQLLGSIALVLSEHQKAIFPQEDTEPLRQYRDRFENDVVREIAVHEYINDSLTFSTARKLYPDRILSPTIVNEMQTTTNPFLWKEMFMNGYKTQTVFLRDAASPGRIAAISLEELDFRWVLFSYLKEFFVCLAVMAIIGLWLLTRESLKNGFPAIGFRNKLVLGFACITLVPLLFLSYYNRQLVAERVQKQGETELTNELMKLQDRINAYVSDEEDFIKGVDDDFCEALATEYGVDFSVYRGSSIQASSRSELYRASLLDSRLNGTVFASIMLDGRTQVLANEKIGSVEYVVGYSPLHINGTIVGVLAIPTLNRQREIEAEVSQQNAYVFGIYAVIFGIALVGGGFLSLRFARPLHTLTNAAKIVAGGNFEVQVSVKSRDEIGTLAETFNDMILKLHASREELAKHERENAWKEMAKQVAHEIRNPLTPMKLSIQHVRQAFKDKAPEREEILQRVTQTVIDQIETLSRIATEFSHFAKMPERKFERISIDDVLKETINLFREVQGINIIDHCSSPDVKVLADSDQLRGVFINIIRNAIQAIEGSGTIIVTTSHERRMCLIKISDTGAGIPEEIRSKIFEPNFSTKSEGMGLGLAIARRVIEDHGGIITCQSERSKGTTFEIRLPM
jgi:nitrogen fixation/metabolism regulation signal transduction histidine kinase